MSEHESLTDGEMKLLETPISHLRQTGQIPSAVAALNKKFDLARAEKNRDRNDE